MTGYTSKIADKDGWFHYSKEENLIWSELYKNQIKLLQERSCDEHIAFIDVLDLPHNEVPQLKDVNRVLKKYSTWQIAPVEGMIGFNEFFNMLKNRRFPAATFIRRREHLSFVSEPDIFHEIFGHAPLLMHRDYGNFSQLIGECGVDESPLFQKLVAAIYWYTCETGACLDDNGSFKIFGASTLSSAKEIVYATSAAKTNSLEFDIKSMISNNYKISELTQTVYHIPDLNFLGSLKVGHIKDNIRQYIKETTQDAITEEL